MKIWILNHYATDMYFDGGGRHHSLAKYLIKLGHDVKIFCANTEHNSSRIVDTEGMLYTKKIGKDNVPYIFIQTRPYKGNGKDRILNMVDYYTGVKKTIVLYVEQYGAPDIIIASSVHPLALIAGLKLSKRYRIPCICEIRDLWPESLISYGFIKRKSCIAKALRFGERKIYEKSDSIVFTMPGGEDYIVDQKWDVENGGKINLNKVYYINNGVDLDLFNKNKKTEIYSDEEWNSFKGIKIVYTGSIRLTNHLEYIVEAAKLLKYNENVAFFIFGDGDKKSDLEELCNKMNLHNVYFKGKIEKKYIPSVLTNGNICITDMYTSNLFKYGISPNKLFDYIAAQKPIISGLISNYDIVQDSGIGITLKSVSADAIYNAICKILSMSNELETKMGTNYKKTAQIYDFKNLANDYLQIIESNFRR